MLPWGTAAQEESESVVLEVPESEGEPTQSGEEMTADAKATQGSSRPSWRRLSPGRRRGLIWQHRVCAPTRRSNARASARADAHPRNRLGGREATQPAGARQAAINHNDNRYPYDLYDHYVHYDHYIHYDHHRPSTARQPL